MKQFILKQIILNPLIFGCSIFLAFLTRHLLNFLVEISNSLGFTLVFGLIFFISLYLIMETIFSGFFHLKSWHYNLIALFLPLLLSIFAYYFCCDSSKAVTLADRVEVFSRSMTYSIFILLFTCVIVFKLLIIISKYFISLLKHFHH